MPEGLSWQPAERAGCAESLIIASGPADPLETALLKAVGARFYRYQGGFLHGKFMLMDQQIASVGTANFDNRSFRLNFEITAVVSDETFAGEVRQMFEHDFRNSRLMVSGELDAKPLWLRLAVRVTRLLAPLL